MLIRAGRGVPSPLDDVCLWGNQIRRWVSARRSATPEAGLIGFFASGPPFEEGDLLVSQADTDARGTVRGETAYVPHITVVGTTPGGVGDHDEFVKLLQVMEGGWCRESASRSTIWPCHGRRGGGIWEVVDTYRAGTSEGGCLTTAGAGGRCGTAAQPDHVIRKVRSAAD